MLANLARVSATRPMIVGEKWSGLEEGPDSWRASYREIGARSRYMQCSRRGTDKSDIENRMPLLEADVVKLC